MHIPDSIKIKEPHILNEYRFFFSTFQHSVNHRFCNMLQALIFLNVFSSNAKENKCFLEVNIQNVADVRLINFLIYSLISCYV